MAKKKTLTTAELIIQSSTEFYSELKGDKNGRYRSWEHCYTCFMDARNGNPDVDYLSLHLAFYLASWGMYRGSSFLLQKDYRVHAPVVKEILKSKYAPLAGIKCTAYRDPKSQQLLTSLIEKMNSIYAPIRAEIKSEDKDVSKTLLTKILMGTLGCVPAYDRYFVDGVKSQGITTGSFNMKSILRLVDFYEENDAVFEPIRKKMKAKGICYPQMKMLDMGFWKIGYDNDLGNKGKLIH